MFGSNHLKEFVSLWAFIAIFTISNVESQSIKIISTTCAGSQLLCGGSICYDPTIQYCTELGTIVQCAGICGNQCYNPSTQQCFNGTVCSLNEQLCVVKYDSSNGYTYNSPYYWCYDPLYEACFNNSLCQHPYRSCNQQCLLFDEVCVNNVTICNVTDVYHNYELEQIQLCNGICYDSFIQQCINDVIQCIENCSGLCYNSSLQQCFDGTVCSLNEQLCVVKYDSWSGFVYNLPYYQCYNPIYQTCFNNSICLYPYRSCNERCLRYNEVCVNNVTVCSVTSVYHNYELDQIQLCNGICFDSAVQQCVDEQVVLCIRDPSTQKCIDQSTSYSQFPNTTTISASTISTTAKSFASVISTTTKLSSSTISTTTISAPTISTTTKSYASTIPKTTKSSTSTISTTTKLSSLSSCCRVKQCTVDADCCIRDTECQCFRHNNQDYGSCLNPYIEPICTERCPVQEQCRNDTDCCKCQCAQITVTHINGALVTKKQCLPR